MSRRTEKLASVIQQELMLIIQRDLADPRLTGLPSVTRVKVSPDLSVADVFVTVMGTEGQQTAALMALKHSAGLMRGRLTRSLQLRIAPYVKFHLDDQLKKEIAVLEVLERVAAENAELDRVRALKAASATPAQETPGDATPGLDATNPDQAPDQADEAAT
jgi:ribosome-binding factor A